jgi:hypothetical protein
MQPSDCISANEGANGVSSDMAKPPMKHENINLLHCSNCHKWVLNFVQAIWAYGNAAHDGTLLVLDLTAVALETDRVACSSNTANEDNCQSHIRCIQGIFKGNGGG